jgi:hypothetical protein
MFGMSFKKDNFIVYYERNIKNTIKNLVFYIKYNVNLSYVLRFEIFTVLNMLIVFFWVVRLCSLIGGYQCFG